jgi:hypothetical protein
MDLLDVKNLFETSVRCLAISMQETMRRQLTLLDDGDYAMNDHIAEAMMIHTRIGSADVKDCLKGLGRMQRALQEIEDYEHWSRKNFSQQDSEAPQIASLMMAFIDGYKNEKLPLCAIEVQNMVRALLSTSSDKPNDKEFGRLMVTFIEQLKIITDQYGIDLEWEDGCSLPVNYLTDWFQNRYWNKKIK